MTIVEKLRYCKECHRKHIVSFYTTLSEEERERLSFMSCHLPFRGYIGSFQKKGYTLDIFDTSPEEFKKSIEDALFEETFNIPKEKRERFLKNIKEAMSNDYHCHCLSCGKRISRETYILYNGLCRKCYYIEVQDLDDL
jgi:hypothetical protein